MTFLLKTKQAFPALLTACLCALSVAHGNITTLRASCQKQLWLTGMQLNNGEFNGLDGRGYLEHMLVAITSARAHAPSLVPVIILLASDKTSDAARARLLKAGAAAVIYHRLSFEADLLKAAGEERGWVERALGSYLRLDVPKFMPKVIDAIAERTVEANYILWTDPDVMFRSDIDSCTLPKPTLLSLGPDVAHEHPHSGGVIYMNVSAYTDIFPAFVEHSLVHGFSTDSVAMDQNMLVRYLQGFCTLLPDLFNYKPYWGIPPAVMNQPSGQPCIVHMQGPKPHRAVCALREYRKQEPTPEQIRAHDWPGRHETLKVCNLDSARHAYLGWLLDVAYSVDRGEMYFQVDDEFERHKAALRHSPNEQ